MPADDALLFSLARKGYGSVDELAKWDTPDLLNLIEFEDIQQDLEWYFAQPKE